MTSSDHRFEIPKNLKFDDITENAIGIDLGTTRCCCAVQRNISIITVPLDNKGERILPSYVGYDEDKEKCGRIVISRLSNFQNSAVFDAKRIIGKKFNDILIDPNWTFSVIPDNEGNPVIKTQRHERDVLLSPSEASSLLLKHIKKAAEDFEGKKLDNVVITVPAVFTGQQCRETIKAAFLAGWKSVKLLPEPIAAAFSYFIDRKIPNNSTMLLFDLGGGTLDVCVFRIVDDKIEIISSEGDSGLGGRDFDKLLFEYFEKKLKSEFEVDAVKKKYKLYSKCEDIKETLSAYDDDSLDVNDFDPAKEGFIKITCEEFEKMSHQLLERIGETLRTALKNIKPSDINDILLVGGGSRMPMIKKLLSNYFPDINQRCEEHPDEVVAMGAAYYACHLLSNPKLRDQWITDKNLNDFKNDSQSKSQNVPSLIKAEANDVPQVDDDILLTIHQGPDEVVSNRTMESTATIYSDGRICGNTKLEAKHWIWGFRGGVKIFVYDEKENLIFESEWTIFGVNMYSDTVRRWGHTMPNPDLFKGKIESAKIIHEHLYKIDGRRFNISF